MQLTVNPKLRVALYVLTAVGTPLMAYLKLKGIMGDLEVMLWSAEVTVAGSLAAFNVNLAKK